MNAAMVVPADEYGDVSIIRRMGILLEREGAAPALLRKLERVLTPPKSLITWIPPSPKRGTLNRRWRVVENDQGRGIL
jgi:predicted transcriptional regulator of viral defense system